MYTETHGIQHCTVFCIASTKKKMYDMFAIKVVKPGSLEIVDHLPLEISRTTKFLLDRSAAGSAPPSCIVVSSRRLGIPCELCVTLPETDKGKKLLDGYKDLFLDSEDERMGCLAGISVTATDAVIFVKCSARKMKGKSF